MTRLEHVNITVPDPGKTAEMLCALFGWTIRWQGSALNDGFAVHVGTHDSYVALYVGAGGAIQQATEGSSYHRVAGLNHIGIVVDDLDDVQKKVKNMGFSPYSHADYEPGRRFYFHDADGVEYEVVSYC